MQQYKVHMDLVKAYQGQFQGILLDLCDGLINKKEDFLSEMIGDLLLIRPSQALEIGYLQIRQWEIKIKEVRSKSLVSQREEKVSEELIE